MSNSNQLPNGWKVVPISEISELITSGATPKVGKAELYSNETNGIPFFRIQNIGIGNLVLSSLKYVTYEVHNTLLERSKVKPGDVLVTITGRLGTAAVVPDRIKEASINQHICLIRLKKAIADPDYVSFHLNSQQSHDEIMQKQHGATRIALNHKSVGSLRIVLPPVETQKKIVSTLKRARSLMQKRELAIQRTTGILKSIFLKMFGDPIKNEKKWIINSLDQISDKITDGKHGDCNDLSNSGYYFISAKDLVDGRIDYSNARQIAKDDFLEVHRRTDLDIGDVLVSNSGTIGRTAIATDKERVKKTTFQKSVAVIKNKQQILNSYFLQCFLELSKDYLINQSSGSSQKNLLLRDIKKFKVMLPPIELQNQFASFAGNVEQIRDSQNKSAREIQRLFNALVHKALRGELVLGGLGNLKS